MIETLSTNTTGAEIAVALSIVAIIGVLWCVWWMRKLTYANLDAFYELQDEVKHAIIKMQEEQCKGKE